MREIRTLLVPTDFSAGAQHALAQAIVLAQRFGSAIRLLHCYRVPTPLELAYLSEHTEDCEKGIRDAAMQQLDEIATPLIGQGLAVSRELMRGSASTAIAKAAGANADLIVMGTLGRTGVAQLLLGSVAERTVREAPCPVLAVRPTAAAPVAPRAILVPIDFSARSDRALAYARELLAKLGDGRIVLLHAHHVEDRPSLPTIQRDSLAWAIARFVPKELEEMAADVKASEIDCEVRIERGAPAAVICERARADHIDWVVMSSHGHSGSSRWLLGSVAERVLRMAPCSVLVLRSRD